MIAITGGSGFIGTHLAGKLSERGEKLRVLDIRKPARSHPAASSFARCDMRSPAQLRKGLRGCSLVFHLAALIDVQRSLREPLEDFETNAIGALNTLDAARELGISRVIYASSAAVYGKPAFLPITEEHPTQPISPYGVSKLCGEQAAKVFSSLGAPETASLRLFNVYGPGQSPNSYAGVITKFADAMGKGGRPVIFGDGRQTRDFIFIDDVVSAMLLASRSKKAAGGVFNIGTGKKRLFQGSRGRWQRCSELTQNPSTGRLGEGT